MAYHQCPSSERRKKRRRRRRKSLTIAITHKHARKYATQMQHQSQKHVLFPPDDVYKYIVRSTHTPKHTFAYTIKISWSLSGLQAVASVAAGCRIMGKKPNSCFLSFSSCLASWVFFVFRFVNFSIYTQNPRPTNNVKQIRRRRRRKTAVKNPSNVRHLCTGLFYYRWKDVEV